MVATFRALGEEFVRLLGRTAMMWWRLLAWLVGFALFGWVGYYGSVLLGSEVARDAPWLVIVCLAAGVVVQLAAIIAALRLVVVRSGFGGDAGADVTPIGLLGQTMLPFLAIFTAFGFVDGYARDVTIVVSQRYSLFGGSEFLSALNPTRSTAALVGVIGVVIGLFVLRRVLESLAERTGRVWLALVATLVEACFGFLLLLSLFRVIEQFWLWLNSREVSAWWDALVDSLVGWFRPSQVLLDVWDVLARSVWPVLWDTLSQPIAWLALTAVVAGVRAASSGDLLERARRRPAAPSALGGAARLGREAFAGDLDDKFLPLWYAFRFLSRAGWPLLGAYVLAFTVVDATGDLLDQTVLTLAGPLWGDSAVVSAPFLGLVPQVLVMGVRLALLGVTTARVHEILAEDRPAAGHRVLQPVLVATVCVAVALSSLALRRDTDELVAAGELGQAIPIMTVVATVEDARAGAALVDLDGASVASDLAFVVVTVSVSQQRDGFSLTPELRAGQRTYRPWEAASLTARPGFTVRRDLVFEVDPGDLAGELTLRLTPLVAVTRTVQIGEVRLPPLSAAEAVDYDQFDREFVA